MKLARDLRIWNETMLLVQQVYLLSRGFPREELFGLTGQIRRAVVSIPSNIAEGYGRSYPREYWRHLGIARGSLMEVQAHLEIANRLGFCTREQLVAPWKRSEIVGKMLTGMIVALGQGR